MAFFRDEESEFFRVFRRQDEFRINGFVDTIRFFPDIFLCGNRNTDIGAFESCRPALSLFFRLRGGASGVLLYSLQKLFRVGVRYFVGNAAPR